MRNETTIDMEAKITVHVDTLEVAGIYSALRALRLPHNGIMKSDGSFVHLLEKEGARIKYSTATIIKAERLDINLMKVLEKKGDHHAKVLRGIMVWAEIEAPLYWWTELETYEVGRTRLSSSSTMHTEGKGLSGRELQDVKEEIPSGRLLKKIDCFSYQTLRRIVYQRHNHRLPEWSQFIAWIKTLPLAEDLILYGLEDLDNGD